MPRRVPPGTRTTRQLFGDAKRRTARPKMKTSRRTKDALEDFPEKERREQG